MIHEALETNAGIYTCLAAMLTLGTLDMSAAASEDAVTSAREALICQGSKGSLETRIMAVTMRSGDGSIKTENHQQNPVTEPLNGNLQVLPHLIVFC